MGQAGAETLVILTSVGMNGINRPFVFTGRSITAFVPAADGSIQGRIKKVLPAIPATLYYLHSHC